MTTVYRVWRCTRCGRRQRQTGTRRDEDGPQWCANCAATTWHIYEGIELA